MQGENFTCHISQVLKCWQQTQGRPSKKRNGYRGIVGIQKPKISRSENTSSIKFILPLLPTPVTPAIPITLPRPVLNRDANLFYSAFHECPLPLFLVRKLYNFNLSSFRQMKKASSHKSIRNSQRPRETQKKN